MPTPELAFVSDPARHDVRSTTGIAQRRSCVGSALRAGLNYPRDSTRRRAPQ